MTKGIIEKVELDIAKSYIYAIKNSLGSNMFRNFFGTVNGEERDITEDGNVACTNHVSTIQYRFKLIKEPHLKTGGLLRDMKNSGWVEITQPRSGCVILYEEKYFGNSDRVRDHVGFYDDEGFAISNNPKLGYPTKHDYQEFDGRTIKKMFWHPKLG